MSRRIRIASLFVLTLIALVLVSYFLDIRTDEQLPLRVLKEILNHELVNGWQLSVAPELEGPYRRSGGSFISNVGGGGGMTYKNKVNQAKYRLQPRDGVEQMIVPLEVEDGRLTIAVLERNGSTH